MDQVVADQLAAAGYRLVPRPSDVRDVPAVGIKKLNDRVLPVEDLIPVVAKDDTMVEVAPKQLCELFAGSKPGFTTDRPSDEYAHFIFMMMWTCMTYSDSCGTPVRDAELVEIYNHLRRRPDGTHSNALYSYLRAAARVYLSVVDTSKAEYESLMDHLRITAKRHLTGPTSTGYLATMRQATKP